MGDTGSLLIGLMVSVFILKIHSTEPPADHFLHMKAGPSVAIGVLLYPLFDLLRVFFIRISHGRSPFSPDRNHIHHLYLDAGYSHRRSTFYILVLNLTSIIFSWFMRDTSIILLGVILFIAALIVTILMRWLVKRRRG